MSDPAFVRELRDWLRFNPREALKRGDGLFSASGGNPTMLNWIAHTLFGMAFTTGGENAKYADQLNSSPGVEIFLAAKDDRDHWVRAGRAAQRFQLAATAMGLKTAYVNPPVEVPSLRAETSALAGFPGRRPNLILRFGYGPSLPFSPRRAPVVGPA